MGMMDLDDAANSAPVGGSALLLSSSPAFEALDVGASRSKGPHAKRERMPCFGEEVESGACRLCWPLKHCASTVVVQL